MHGRNARASARAVRDLVCTRLSDCATRRLRMAVGTWRAAAKLSRFGSDALLMQISMRIYAFVHTVAVGPGYARQLNRDRIWGLLVRLTDI